MSTPKLVNLALQGGGAHGAFTWGVLDKLLDDDRIRIESISGTSAGAMNAVVLADGIHRGGPDAARQALHDFWKAVSDAAQLSPLRRAPLDVLTGNWNLDHSPAFLFFDLLSRVASPYDMNPLDINPLRDLLSTAVNFDNVRCCHRIKLFISATSVRSGRIRVFEQHELTVDMVMASACLPWLFKAVEIDDEPYWDGGYTGNPALFPFFHHCQSNDIIIVQINPLEVTGTPKTAREILNRLNEITFNASLMKELRAIEFVSRLLEQHRLDPALYSRMLIHRIDSDELITLNASSKLNAEWDFLVHLHDIGCRAASDWLDQNHQLIGQESSVVVPAMFGGGLVDYEYLLKLKRDHPTLKLLNADSAPLIISFLYRYFIETNQRAIPRAELVEKLEDTLFHLRQLYGDKLYPRSARAYLDDWASGEQAFLRKYYPPQGDEPEYDLTPATETVIEWLRSLRQRQFVGTESRLLTLFNLLQDIISATEADPQRRIAELEQQKSEIDNEIIRLREGRCDSYDPTQIKERYYQVEDTARRLLSDFRQVEENFRTLDRQVREKIATTDSTKSALLDDIFSEQDSITDSDQGKSFRAFWTLLMNPLRQENLAEMINKMLLLPEVKNLDPDTLLARMQDHLLEAGGKVKHTSAALMEQLRRFLDDQVWLENKRIMALVHKIEKQAVATRQQPPPERQFIWLDELKIELNLPLIRPLFQPPQKSAISEQLLLDGDADFSSDRLFDIHYVDAAALRANIRRALQSRSQIALSELCRQQPLEKGLAELVTYLHIASDDPKALIDDGQRQEIFWLDSQGEAKRATLPAVIFTR